MRSGPYSRDSTEQSQSRTTEGRRRRNSARVRSARYVRKAVVPEPDSDLPVRKIGEYELTAKIGVGGMGVVYEGRHPLIGKRVAVKVLMPSFSREKELVERFIAEARAVNEIRHRGIVDIFSFGQLPDGSHYFVMEYLEGEPFDQLIKRRGPMPIGEVLSLMEEILDALDAAHAAGIIHRDIKPSNLFLVNQGRGRTYVKLLDFGIAKLGVSNNSDTPQTRASVILGTPDYISPEQARGRPISARTDLYALGVVMFELLTGERPFQGENTLATMWMHVEDPPPVASDVRPDIPPQLDELILWAMEKDPADRPQSAEDMRAHIESIRASLLPGIGSAPSPLSAREPLSVPKRSGTPSPLKRRTPMPNVAGARKSSSAAVPIVSEPRPPLPSSQETRLAPLPSFEDEPATYLQRPEFALNSQSAELARVTTEPERQAVSRHNSKETRVKAALEDEGLDEPPKRNNGGLIIAFVVLLVLATIAVVLVNQEISPNSPPPAQPIIAKPAKVEPPPIIKPKVPVVEKPAAVIEKPAAVIEKPAAKVKPPPETAAPPKSRPAVDRPDKPNKTQALEARLSKLEAKLAAREAQTGEPDKVMRNFVGQAKKMVAGVQTDADRREASSFLDEIAEQLGR